MPKRLKKAFLKLRRIPGVRADRDAPLELFNRLRTARKISGTFCLFERPEFSWIGFDPLEVSRFADGVFQAGASRMKASDPFRAMRDRALDFLSRPQDRKTLAKLGAPIGGIGYFGYDCVKYLEKIPLPRAPKEKQADAAFAVFRNVIFFDHQSGRAHAIHFGFSPREAAGSAREFENWLKASRKRPLSSSRMSAKAPKLLASIGKPHFRSAISRVKAHIRDGDIFQCVLSDRFRFTLQGDSLKVYESLRALGPSPYLYYIGLEGRTILGASPETLVAYDGRSIQTYPIAGTRPRGKSREQDRKLERQMVRSPKERAEHLMLVDLGRNDLGRVCEPGSVRVPEFMQVKRYSHVMHLVSRVEGRLKKKLTAWDALASCFPAGTLSGAPKIRAMQIISDLEPERRGIYGGAITTFDFSGGLDACIAIRTLVIRGREAILQAGAGVVADSQADREYAEIQNKARGILTAVRSRT